MAQCITYIVDTGLYINMTNRCTCDCDFCERNFIDAVGNADSLWLDYEPSQEEILESITGHNLTLFSELVFCGFGEPMLRADDLFYVAQRIKQIMPTLPIRINTNGHANIIANRDITPNMSGIIDRLSISLNRADETSYMRHIRPVFGISSFNGVLEFIEKSRRYVPEIRLTVLDLLTPDEIEQCKKIADSLGVDFYVRTTKYFTNTT